MADFNINHITGKQGQQGTVLAGITTVSSTGAMRIPSGPTEQRGGRGRGINGGGSSSVDVMDYVDIATTGNAQDFGNLTVGRRSLGAVSSATRGVWMGGIYSSTWSNTIDYVTISSQGGASDFGDLDSLNGRYDTVSNRLIGITGGGNDPSGYRRDMRYINIASTGDASLWGDLNSLVANQSACSSPTRGLMIGGYIPAFVDNIQYINLSSKGNGQDFGKLSIGTYNASKSQAGNSTRGLIGGGYIAPASATTNTIEYVTIATLGNGTDFGDLTEARTKLGATSNATRGIFMGGDPGPGSSNIIDYVTVASTGNATDFGDTPTAYQDTAALSDTHGGIGD